MSAGVERVRIVESPCQAIRMIGMNVHRATKSYMHVFHRIFIRTRASTKDLQFHSQCITFHPICIIHCHWM